MYNLDYLRAADDQQSEVEPSWQIVSLWNSYHWPTWVKDMSELNSDPGVTLYIVLCALYPPLDIHPKELFVLQIDVALMSGPACDCHPQWLFYFVNTCYFLHLINKFDKYNLLNINE